VSTFSDDQVRQIRDSISKQPIPVKGDIQKAIDIQIGMRQPTDQEERNEDKKKPEENPSRGIDPESGAPEMEVDQDPGERQKENQNQQKDDPLAA
jgi:hypothetical protein